jgi:hypothetical protein
LFIVISVHRGISCRQRLRLVVASSLSSSFKEIHPNSPQVPARVLTRSVEIRSLTEYIRAEPFIPPSRIVAYGMPRLTDVSNFRLICPAQLSPSAAQASKKQTGRVTTLLVPAPVPAPPGKPDGGAALSRSCTTTTTIGTGYQQLVTRQRPKATRTCLNNRPHATLSEPSIPFLSCVLYVANA